jgi:hypothetical protein
MISKRIPHRRADKGELLRPGGHLFMELDASHPQMLARVVGRERSFPRLAMQQILTDFSGKERFVHIIYQGAGCPAGAQYILAVGTSRRLAMNCQVIYGHIVPHGGVYRTGAHTSTQLLDEGCAVFMYCASLARLFVFNTIM